MPWGFKVKREGIFENAFTFYFKSWMPKSIRIKRVRLTTPYFKSIIKLMAKLSKGSDAKLKGRMGSQLQKVGFGRLQPDYSGWSFLILDGFICKYRGFV